jgi:hypothetical protein
MEMKHGAFNMILEAHDKVCNGNRCIPMTQESLHDRITNEDNAHNFDIKSTVHFEFIPPGQSTSLLYGNSEVVV